jgi:hypothetical protein
MNEEQVKEAATKLSDRILKVLKPKSQDEAQIALLAMAIASARFIFSVTEEGGTDETYEDFGKNVAAVLDAMVEAEKPTPDPATEFEDPPEGSSIQ